MTKKSVYERHGLLIAALGCALAPFVAWGATKALLSNTNDVRDWLPAHYVETAEYQWFRRHFGSDEFVLITWEGCTLEDPRLAPLATKLRAFGEGINGGEGRFDRVVTAASVLAELMAPPVKLTREAALERLKGSLVGPDGRQACAIVWLTDRARRSLHATLDSIRATVAECGVPSDAIKLGGPPVVNAAIDVVSVRSLNNLIVLTAAVGVLIAWCSIRELRLTILVLVTGVYAAAASLAFLWLCGVRMNAILITMIPMVYVTATSGAIHLCNYYQQSVREAGGAGAAGRAVAHALLPLGLATGTTAAGLLSICYNDLLPIQQFGLFSAVGVGLSWLLLVLWLPASLAVWPARDGQPAGVTGPEDTGEAPLPDVWRRLGDTVVRRQAWMAATCLVLMALCLPGLSRLKVSIDLMQEFTSDAQIIQDYTWLEERLGPLMPMEVIIRLDNKTCPLNMLARARLVERAQRRIEALDEVGGAISAMTFAPDLRGRGPARLRDMIENNRLKKHRDRLVEAGYLTPGDGEELWRISVRVAALRQVDYGEFVKELRGEVEQVLQAERDQGHQGISASFTGVAPVLFKARHSLVDGLILGLGTDLLLIVVTITVAMRHWSSGLLLLLTSLFPTALVLGTAGWLGLTIDLGAVMTPCVALGVSVDDVIHFLIWFRWGVQRGMDRPRAVQLAWQACARPMYQSWALLGLGMATLVVSSFVPILQFGAMMVAMLSAGLAGSLLFLPALLAGPLGAIIGARPRAEARATSREQSSAASSGGLVLRQDQPDQ